MVVIIGPEEIDIEKLAQIYENVSELDKKFDTLEKAASKLCRLITLDTKHLIQGMDSFYDGTIKNKLRSFSEETTSAIGTSKQCYETINPNSIELILHQNNYHPDDTHPSTHLLQEYSTSLNINKTSLETISKKMSKIYDELVDNIIIQLPFPQPYIKETAWAYILDQEGGVYTCVMDFAEKEYIDPILDDSDINYFYTNYPFKLREGLEQEIRREIGSDDEDVYIIHNFSKRVDHMTMLNHTLKNISAQYRKHAPWNNEYNIPVGWVQGKGRMPDYIVDAMANMIEESNKDIMASSNGIMEIKSTKFSEIN
ncbi:hypothetical protein HQ545_05150 [Candidatus Woesearchaeota archaeon]|nr:hypothetical protein [Candidatus Woesearchaeota archaeon]